MGSNEKVKVSNLPLLFVKGNPTSLELMSLEELQAFLRFMMKCEGNRKELPDLDRMTKPSWWPEGFEFSETILMRQNKNRGKLSLLLKNAIRSCYSYHECAFLIDFCRKLLDYTGGVQNLQVLDNRDGTRSLIKRRDKKLLVTFKAENQDYDKESKRGPKKQENKTPASSPMKLLDSRRLLQTLPVAPTSDPDMSRCVAELYLCDTCDKDFDSLPLLMEHEKICSRQPDEYDFDDDIIIADSYSVGNSAADSSFGPDDGTSAIAVVRAKKKQAQFFDYMKLSSASGQPPEKKVLREEERPKVLSYDKYTEIDLSSPLGSYLIRGSRLLLDQQNPAARCTRGYMTAEDYNNQLEAKCPGTIPTLRGSNAYADIRTKFPNVYRGARPKPGAYHHVYSFTMKERMARYRDLKRGLSVQAYRLFKRANKRKSEVKLQKMAVDVVKFYTAKYRERIARLEAEEAKQRLQQVEEEVTEDQSAASGRMEEAFKQRGPLTEIQIDSGSSNSVTPSSTPSHSPRVTAIKSSQRSSRQSSPSSAILIDSDSESSDVQEVDSLGLRILVNPHTTTIQGKSQTISVKLFDPMDEFAPSSDQLDCRPAVMNNVSQKVVSTSSRFVPCVPTTATVINNQPCTGLAPASPAAPPPNRKTATPSSKQQPKQPALTNRNSSKVVKGKGQHHTPNILLKSKQSRSVEVQLKQAASSRTTNNTSVNGVSGGLTESTKPEPSITPRAQTLPNGRQQAKSPNNSSHHININNKHHNNNNDNNSSPAINSGGDCLMTSSVYHNNDVVAPMEIVDIISSDED